LRARSGCGNIRRRLVEFALGASKMRKNNG